MTRKRARPLCAGLLLALAAPAAVLAQSDARIGYVNMNFILQNHPRTMEVNETLSAEFTPREAELRTAQSELQEKARRYENDAAVMPPAERTALERELAQGERDLERRLQQLNEDFQIRQNELVQQLQREVIQQVQRYVSDEGYDLVVVDALYAGDSVNITTQVLEAITSD